MIILPVRQVVLFPGVVLPSTIARPNSIAAAQEVFMATGNLLHTIPPAVREAGVPNLERLIGAIYRHAAMRIAEGADDLHTIVRPRRFETEVAMRTSVPGGPTGLAWAPVGGTSCSSRRRGCQFLALASLFTGRTFRSDTAISGEISLRSLVLRMAARQKCAGDSGRGITTVMLPSRNRKDLEDLLDAARQKVRFVWLDWVDDAVTAALPDREEKRQTAEHIEQAGGRQAARSA